MSGASNFHTGRGNCPASSRLLNYHRLPPAHVQTFEGRRYSFEIPGEIAETLKAFSQKEGATLFMTLLAAFKVLLSAIRARRICLLVRTAPTAIEPETRALIGFFINTLAMRTDISGNPTFRELLARVKETALGAFAHKDMPFDMLAKELQLDGNRASGHYCASCSCWEMSPARPRDPWYEHHSLEDR